MAKHKTTFTVPSLIAPQRFANNGLTVSPTLLTRVANGLNYVAGIQKRSLFLKSNFLEAPDTSSPFDLWQGYFRTSENTTGIVINAGFIPQSAPSSTSYLLFTLFDSTGSTIDTVDFGYRGGRSGSGQVWPDDIKMISHRWTGLSADTEYQWKCGNVGGCTLAFMSIAELVSTEVDDTVNGVCNPGAFVDGAPIYDSHISDLQDAAKRHWRHSGSHLLSWCYDYDFLTANTIATSTWTNMVDGTSTSVSAASKGFYIASDYKNTASRTTVPVKVAFNVGISGTANLDVRLTDGTNSITVSGITATPAANGWTTATGTIPSTGAQWDLQARRNSGAGTCTIYAVSMWEYEA